MIPKFRAWSKQERHDLFNTDIFEIETIGNIYTNPKLAEVSS